MLSFCMMNGNVLLEELAGIPVWIIKPSKETSHLALEATSVVWLAFRRALYSGKHYN